MFGRGPSSLAIVGAMASEQIGFAAGGSGGIEPRAYWFLSGGGYFPPG